MPPVVLAAYIIVRYWRCQEVWGNWRKLLHFFGSPHRAQCLRWKSNYYASILAG